HTCVGPPYRSLARRRAATRRPARGSASRISSLAFRRAVPREACSPAGGSEQSERGGRHLPSRLRSVSRERVGSTVTAGSGVVGTRGGEAAESPADEAEAAAPCCRSLSSGKFSKFAPLFWSISTLLELPSTDCIMSR